jgi:molybdenum cofactor cytidylyltransferase
MLKHNTPLDIILLAAGMSRRMGAQNKLLLPFKNSTILETTIHNIIDAGIGKMTIVLGHEADIVTPFLQQFMQNINNPNPLIVNNLNYEKGMTTSIQMGVHASNLPFFSDLNTRGTEGGYMICLSDMPLISPEEYSYLAHQFSIYLKKDKKAIVQPIYQGERGNPTIFSKIYKEDILNLTYPEGCKPIVQAYKEHLYLVEMPTPSVLRDADTPEAYQELIANRH